MSLTYDIAVIGSTSAALAAAELARERGLSVVVVTDGAEAVDNETRWTDLLLKTGAARNAFSNPRSTKGVYHHTVKQAWRNASATPSRTFETFAQGTASPDGRFSISRGAARLRSRSRLELPCGTGIDAGALIIANGASPRRPARFDFRSPAICDADEMIHFGEPPRSVVILGADWIGCEWAFVCASTGAEVTLVDRRSRLLRALDSDIRLCVQSSLIEMGIDIVLDEEVDEVENGEHGEVRVRFSSGRRQVAEKLLVLAGQQANSQALGLSELGVQLDPYGHIMVDDSFQSSVSGVYGIGAVSDPTGLGPSSTLQAHIAVASATGQTGGRLPLALPWVLRSAVEVAICGLTEEACAALGLDTAVHMAQSPEAADGFPRVAKVVVSNVDGRLLGVQIAGSGAAESISLASSLIDQDCRQGKCDQVGVSENTTTDLFCRAMRSAAGHWQKCTPLIRENAAERICEMRFS